MARNPVKVTEESEVKVTVMASRKVVMWDGMDEPQALLK